MYRTPNSTRERAYGPIGCRIKDKNTLVFDDRGNMKLEKVGEIDTYDLIQSYGPECDIEYLVKRFERGDVECLNRRQGFYGDISTAPTNPADYRNSVIRMQGVFEADEKLFEKYHGDFGKFLEDHQTFDAVSSLLGINSKKTEGVMEQPAAASGDGDEQKQ